MIKNDKKNDKKIYPPLVTMSSIYFLIVLVIISLSRYTVRWKTEVFIKEKRIIFSVYSK